jgi:hypothetical protein
MVNEELDKESIMDNKKILLFIQVILLLIPLNVYMWGDWLLVNVQWALFRYQQSPIGSSLILGYKDILYIVQGQTSGSYNILAALFWTIGGVLLLIGLLITLFGWVNERSGFIKTASFFTLGGGVLFLFSALGRFMGGFSIPLGVPIILLIGWWMYQQKPEPEDDEDTSVGEKTTSIE